VERYAQLIHRGKTGISPWPVCRFWKILLNLNEKTISIENKAFNSLLYNELGIAIFPGASGETAPV
jgi:hypothetical protein